MRQATQLKKEQLLINLTRVRRQILATAAALPEIKQECIFLGIWSVKDLLAHLIGWDITNLAAAHSVIASQLPDFYAFIDRDWKTYNAQLVTQYRQDDFVELLASVERSHLELLDFLRSLPAETLFKDFGVRYKGYHVTIARLLESEMKDEEQHFHQIEQWT